VTRTVFLDRDGTLNAEVGFVTGPEHLRLLPRTVAAIAALRAAVCSLVVVTNQSGIARGLLDQVDLARIHDKLQTELDGAIAGFFHCPHHPDGVGPYGGACTCRKPAPGLMLQARDLLGVDFAGGAVVGDSSRDLLAAAGLPLRRIYVRSGKPPAAELAALAAAGLRADAEVDDLFAAVPHILGGA
jgi:histidinol-phosphate phosphatase family protein